MEKDLNSSDCDPRATRLFPPSPPQQPAVAAADHGAGVPDETHDGIPQRGSLPDLCADPVTAIARAGIRQVVNARHPLTKLSNRIASFMDALPQARGHRVPEFGCDPRGFLVEPVSWIGEWGMRGG